jgi:hypothetical protein
MSTKPKEPRPEFSLDAHVCGQWGKKIRGNIHYFGAWADPQAALARYLDEKDGHLAGQTVRRR